MFLQRKKSCGTRALRASGITASEPWGDYDRTLTIIDGNVVDDTGNESALEFVHGIKTEQKLHDEFIHYIKPDMTFEEVYLHMNEVIQNLGYINLDFTGNLGHSIEFDKDHSWLIFSPSP
ncbi:hypothetical protein [Paenibacillus gorillae]|uniref:hypothetical protein n=1 Tax=Paenibacillus gorillae TaxID=1243662 RepID=UPI001EE33F0E|nr:hypothetical protein [Paenibacillus gorillae]